YQSDETGRPEVYVTAFPRPSGRWQISTSGGRQPRWRRDTKEVFYLAGDTLMAAAVKGHRDRFEVGDVRRLFNVRLRSGAQDVYDVSSDGQRFLVDVVDEQPTAPSPITFVVNWPALLKK